MVKESSRSVSQIGLGCKRGKRKLEDLLEYINQSLLKRFGNFEMMDERTLKRIKHG